MQIREDKFNAEYKLSGLSPTRCLMETMFKSLNALKKKIPSAADEINHIVALREVMSNLQPIKFFEPLSEIRRTNDKLELANFNAQLLAAWIGHIASSTIVRLQSLEEGVVDELSKGRYLNSMALARSHMESAAVITYSLQLLNSSANNKDLSPVKNILLKTFFGTSLKRAGKKDDGLREFLNENFPEVQDYLVNFTQAVSSMDEYYAIITEQKTTKFSTAYAHLCDYAHPTVTGCKHFVEILSETEEGWFQIYRANEKVNPLGAKFLLLLLLDNMRFGYASSVMMMCGKCENTPTGDVIYHKPPISTLRKIWEDILQLK